MNVDGWVVWKGKSRWPLVAKSDTKLFRQKPPPHEGGVSDKEAAPFAYLISMVTDKIATRRV